MVGGVFLFFVRDFESPIGINLFVFFEQCKYLFFSVIVKYFFRKINCTDVNIFQKDSVLGNFQPVLLFIATVAAVFQQLLKLAEIAVIVILKLIQFLVNIGSVKFFQGFL